MGQLFYRNLHLEFFERFPSETTDFFAVSGYVGPDPISKLRNLPFNSKIIYGLQRETNNAILHEQLKKIHSDKVSILYATVPSHAKCYVWASGDKPLRGLIGSANFSTNGLNNDFRETLIEIERPDLHAIWAYINLIGETAKKCVDTEAPVKEALNIIKDGACDMVLYDPSSGQVQDGHGLNWGFAKANVNPNDACIPIRVAHLRQYPHLFPPVFFNPSLGHRSRSKSKECVELIWDDGTIMEALFEGSQPVDNLIYPKQISSIPNKDILGRYIRSRLGLAPVSSSANPAEKIKRADLERYGRSSIALSIIQPGIYSADFSNK